MIPFVKMGQFICFNIAVALLFAIGMFSALLAQFGPAPQNPRLPDWPSLYTQFVSREFDRGFVTFLLCGSILYRIFEEFARYSAD